MAAQARRSIFAAALRAFPLLEEVDPRAFLVGGAVRDLLRGRAPRDADLAIRGAAAEAEGFARRTGGRLIRLGSAPFDVLRVACRGKLYDFAEIVGASIEEDLARRDFTIGAVALPLAAPHELVDPFDGARDLDASTLRMLRESNFADDPLRVVRGARLVAELALSVEEATFEAMSRHAAEVAGVAPERLGTEWLALLAADDAGALRRGLDLVRRLGVDRCLVGGSLEDAAIGTAAALRAGDAMGRLAAIALAGDVTTLCETSMRLGLGASRVDAVRRACRVARSLLGGADEPVDPVVLHDEGEEATRRGIELVRANGRSELADRAAGVVDRDGEGIFGASPLLDGHAIVALTGIPPGPRVGALRRALLVAQLRGEVTNRDEAAEFVRAQAYGA